MSLKDVLKQIPEPKETASLADDRMIAISGKNIKNVVLGSVNDPKTIPARFDPETRVFYPLFKQG
jgi:hypothetical protein